MSIVGMAGAHAATTADLYVDISGTSTSCAAPGTAACASVHAAIAAATAGGYAGEDVTIHIAAGSYPATDSIHAGSLHSLTLDGAAAASTTLDGNQAGTVLTIAGGTVTIQKLAVTGGAGSGNGGGIANTGGTVEIVKSIVSNNSTTGSGGGIYNAGTMTVTASSVGGNTAASTGSYGYGGGIDNENGASLTVTGSTIDNNTVSGQDAGFGGGIEDNGSLAVLDSTISHNDAEYGGGIDGEDRDIQDLTINDSTVSDNTARTNGGGIVFYGGGTMTVTGSTIDDNTAGFDGGAMFAATDLTIADSTLSGNSARNQAGGIFNEWLNYTPTPSGIGSITDSTFSNDAAAGSGNWGGAVLDDDGQLQLSFDTIADDGPNAFHVSSLFNPVPGRLTLSNSLLSNSPCEAPDPANFAVPVTDGGYNVEDDNSCGLSAANHSVVDSPSIGLAPALSSNGSQGPQTLAIGAGSSALGVVPAAACSLGTDERGLPRPGVTGLGCDAGAYELQGTPVSVFTSGSQTYGSSTPSFSYVYNAPSGVTVSGALACTTVNSGTPISPTLPAGTYNLDASSCSGLSASGPGLYQLAFTGSFTVKRAPLAVAVTGSQVFGGAPVFTASTSVAGVSATAVSCAAVTAGGGTTITPALTAGSYKLDGSTCAATLSDTRDYSPTYSGSFTVSRAPVTVTITGSQTFGGSPSFTADTGVSGLSATGASCTQVTAGGGTTITAGLPAGSYTLLAATCRATLSDTTDYAPTYAGSFTVGREPVTVTVTGSQTYGGAPAFTGVTDLPGVTVTAVTCSGVTAGGGTAITATLAAGPYTLAGSTCTATLSDTTDYTPSITGAAFTVDRAPVTVTVTGSQNYGGAASFTASTSVPAVSAGGASCAQVTAGGGTTISPSLPAGSYILVPSTCTATLSDAHDYAVTYTGGAFTVDRAAVAVAVTGRQTYGGMPAFTATTDVAGVSATAASCTGVTADGGTAITPTLTAGAYTLAGSTCTATLSDPSNYTPTYSGTFTVAKAPVTVSVTGSQSFGGTPSFSASASASAVTASAVSCAGVTAGGGTTITATLPAGSYTLAASTCTATLSDPSDYTASYTGGAFTVSRAPVTVTVTGSQTYGGAPSFTATTDVSGLLATGATCTQVTAGGGTSITATMPAGGYTLTSSSCTATLSDQADYIPTIVGGGFTVNRAPVRVTVAGSQTYGGTASFTSTTNVSGVSATGASCTQVTAGGGTSITAGLAAGAYTLVGSSCAATLSDSNDYVPTYLGAAFAVSRAPLTITASSPTVQYGQTVVVNPSYAGFVSGDSATTAFTTPPTCTSSKPVGTAPGTYAGAASCSGAVAPNYLVSYTPGTVTVTTADTSVSAEPLKRGLLTLTFTATLTRAFDGAPLPAQSIAFKLGITGCSATTSSTGVATCTVVGIALTTVTYTATYAGDLDYNPASGKVTS